MKKILIIVFSVAVLLSQGFLRSAHALQGGYDKGFYLLSDDEKFKIKLNFKVVPNYTYEYKETKFDTSTFQLGGAGTAFSGYSFSKNVTYRISVGYSDKGASLGDAYVELAIAKPFKVTVGQSYLPINREDYYSAYGTQMVSESIVSGHFGVGRDLGLVFSGKIVKPLEYYFFFTNGDGPKTANKNREVLIGTRLEGTVVGELTGFQGDPDYSSNPNLGFGGTILYDFGSAAETAGFDDEVALGIKPNENRLVRGDLDGAFAWHGWNLLGQWQFVYNNRFRAFDHGYMVQSGYFILPHKLEVAGRYSNVIPDFPYPALALTGITKDNEGSPNPVYELAGGINYYFKGDKMKVQAEYRQILNVGGVRNLNDQVIQAQLYLEF